MNARFERAARLGARLLCTSSLLVLGCDAAHMANGIAASADAAVHVPVPTIESPWREIAGNPDLGALNAAGQQVADFAIWQAADGSWQLQSCIRFTLEPGGSRLFYRWRAARFEDSDWEPVGIAMHADPDAGEKPGWLQAPFVVRRAGVFHMFYGNGTHVCQATSSDGVDFQRRLTDAGVTAMYSDGVATRDPMLLRDGDRWIAYTSAARDGHNGIYARTSKDLEHWSEPTLVSEGGRAGDGPESAECPFVIYRPDVRLYYLFRNQLYGEDARNTVYASPDPLNFGVNDDRYFVTELPIAAPEIVSYEGQTYIVALRDTLDGIQIAPLAWR